MNNIRDNQAVYSRAGATGRKLSQDQMDMLADLYGLPRTVEQIPESFCDKGRKNQFIHGSLT